MSTPEQTKAALKEALKEWLDDKFADVGRWTVGGFAAAATAAGCWAILRSHGYRVGN
jgi:hypothetical protein